MKIIVDKMPKSKKECPFSKWHPYPPFTEQPGYYECNFNVSKEYCSLNNNSCNCMKLIEEQLSEMINEKVKFYTEGQVDG